LARPKPAAAPKLVSAAGIILLALLAAPAQAQAPDPFAAHIRAAEAAARGGLPLVAAAEYRAAVRLHPADTDARFALGGVLEEAGRADEAITQYRALIALRPDNAPAHNALAALLEGRGETAAALAQYRQALALAPSDPRLHFNLAAALGDAGRPAEAAAQYRAALRLRPDFAEAQRALARLPRPTRAPLAARRRVRKRS